MKRHSPHYENVPTGWTKTRLGNLINIVSGVSYNKSDITSNSHGIRILRGGNVQNGKIILEENDVHVLSAYHDEEKIVKKGDIVIVASTGSQLLIGKTGYANHDFSMTQIGAFLRIIRTKANCLSSYINLVLCSDSFKEHIQSLAKGTNINNLKANHVTDFEILMPPYREQQRIVAKVEELHRTLERIAECLS